MDRTLSWPDCRNVRDLGGLPTVDGGRIRPGALVRSDDLSQLTDDGVAALRGYGISCVIDLRGPRETTQRPGPFAADPMYRWTPFIDERADLARDPSVENTLEATYQGSLRRNVRTIAAAIAAFADAPPGGVVVHCAAGKDRTGIFVALLLRTAGVAPEDIAADYARTNVDTLRPVDAIDLEACRPEIIVELLRHVDEQYGSVDDYLAHIGLRPDQVAAVRDRLR